MRQLLIETSVSFLFYLGIYDFATSVTRFVRSLSQKIIDLMHLSSKALWHSSSHLSLAKKLTIP
jgi:hypothetical protein